MTSNNKNLKQIESQTKLDCIQMNSSKTVAPKRLSIIDRGKSWARQFIKSSKLLQRSSDSCDSGIDVSSKINTTTSAYSIKTTMMSPVAKSASLSSKLPETYNQVYSSPCNSNSSALSTSSSSTSSSSSGYLISPLDESGYLVPIVNLINCSNDTKQTKNVQSNTPTTSITNNINNSNEMTQLTRSQSTRSAYTTCSSNLTSSSSFYSHFNNANRATICESLNDDNKPNQKNNICIKCNCKLDKSKDLNNYHIEQNEEDLAKSNRVYNLFESFTCSTCLNSDINCNKKPSQQQQQQQSQIQQKQQHQTIIPTNPPPPLPLLPPPSLKKSLQINHNESPNNKQHFTVIKNNLNHHRHTIILVTNNFNPNCSQNTNTDDNLNNILKKITHQKQQQISNNNTLIGDSNIKITPLVICTPNITQSTHQYTINNNNKIYNHHYNINNNNIKSNRSTSKDTKQLNATPNLTLTNEPIIYIDSIDELENYSISSSISSLSSISSPDKSSHSDSYSIDMNQLLARLKNTTKNLSNLQHNDSSNSKHLTPSNSVESFEFITDNQVNNSNIKSPVVVLTADHNAVCYEKSWDNNQTSVLLDRLSQDTTENVLTNSSIFLASSLIEIANQQQEQNNQTHILRNRKSNVPAVRRISFPLQKLSSFREFEKLTSIPSNANVKQTNSNSSINSSSIPVIKAHRIIFKHSSVNQYNTQQTINNSTDEVEQLITVPKIRRDQSESFKSKKATSNKSYSNSSSCSSSSSSTASSSCNSNRYSYVISHKLETCNQQAFNSSIEDLTDVAWYQPNMPRENVQNYLANKEIGSFIIRLSNTCKDCFALSIRVPYFANQNGIAHYLIIRNSRGYKLKGVEKDFKSLKSLVTHYSVMQEILPVTLNLNISSMVKIKSNDINQIGICKN